MYHSNTEMKKQYIIKQLKRCGICVDITSGRIFYHGSSEKNLKCHSLYLLRHAETTGIEEKRFMSDFSSNSILTKKGISDVKEVVDIIGKMKFDLIFYSPIIRVKQTVQVIWQHEKVCDCYVEIPYMKGIDNAGWEGKGVFELQGEDYEDFYQREILHNIFARSSKGCSWGDVLLRCIELIEFINSYYANKKILLISQGSIFLGLKIILHLEEEIWKDYNPELFFGLTYDSLKNYSKLQYIFGDKIEV